MDEYISQEAATAEVPRRPTFDPPPPRRVLLPAVLFLLTCLSTLYAGGARTGQLADGSYVFHFDWTYGLTYMAAVIAILSAHEMGHFLQARRHGVPASWPYFIPMPFTPLGTMGAVIGMRGSQADRKQLFDIGLTGPLAGLAVLLPIAWYGIRIAVPTQVPDDAIVFHDPLLFQWMIRWLRPECPPDQVFINNPYYMAAWVGMLITGLNMVPISQLDGGHTAYALFGRGAYLLARLVVLGALASMFYTQQYTWMMMLLLVMAIGIDHPPTLDDRVELGFGRRLIGLLSLVIPLLCLAPLPISTAGGG